MEDLITQLTQQACHYHMVESISKQLVSDPVYLIDTQDLDALDTQFAALELSMKQRIIANDYIACLESRSEQACFLSYKAGIRDAVLLLNERGLLAPLDKTQ